MYTVSELQHRLQDGSLHGAYTVRMERAFRNARRFESMIDIVYQTIMRGLEAMHAEGAVTTNEYSYASVRLFSGGFIY